MKTQIIITPQLTADGFFLGHETGMLVLTRLENTPLGPTPKAVDQALNGLITRRSASQKFTGALGQSILFDLDPKKFGERAQRYVLLVGIGSASKFNGRAACQVFRLALDQALDLGVSKMTIPFAPNRMTVPTLNLKGTAHILSSVVADNEKRLSRSALEQVELLCTPQARKHVMDGLMSKFTRDCCSKK